MKIFTLEEEAKGSEFFTFIEGYYLAKLTLDSIANLFSGAHAIKKWLRDCAATIAST